MGRQILRLNLSGKQRRLDFENLYADCHHAQHNTTILVFQARNSIDFLTYVYTD
jgi:hypothetical protein